MRPDCPHSRSEIGAKAVITVLCRESNQKMRPLPNSGIVCALGKLLQERGAHVYHRGHQEALQILQIALVNIRTVRLTYKNSSL
jgi:hypothetical protein